MPCLVALPLGVIGRLCSGIVAVPGHLRYYFVKTEIGKSVTLKMPDFKSHLNVYWTAERRAELCRIHVKSLSS